MKVTDLLREMIESGVIKYGDEFLKSMEAGHWDLSKVDMNEWKITSGHGVRTNERTAGRTFFRSAFRSDLG